jgi:hypothetical protein
LVASFQLSACAGGATDISESDRITIINLEILKILMDARSPGK